MNYLSKTYTFTKTIPKAVGVEGGVWAMGVRGLKGWGDGFLCKTLAETSLNLWFLAGLLSFLAGWVGGRLAGWLALATVDQAPGTRHRVPSTRYQVPRYQVPAP